MGVNLLDVSDDILKERTFFVFDDFDQYVDATRHTKGATGTGAVANNDNPNGILTLTSGATANSEAWVATTRKNWRVATNVPIMAQCRLNFQEANNNNLCLFFGLSDSFATGLLASGTGIPNTNMNAYGIYIQQGDTAGSIIWRAISSVGATQIINTSTDQSAGDANDTMLRIMIEPVSSTIAEASYFVGRAGKNPLLQLIDATTLRPFKHNVTFGATKMAFGTYIRGVSTTSETVNLDHEWIGMLRAPNPAR